MHGAKIKIHIDILTDFSIIMTHSSGLPEMHFQDFLKI